MHINEVTWPCRRCLSEAERVSLLRAHCRFIGLGSASTGHWPINRRCANKLCAYRVWPILVVKTHYLKYICLIQAPLGIEVKLGKRRSAGAPATQANP